MSEAHQLERTRRENIIKILKEKIIRLEKKDRESAYDICNRGIFGYVKTSDVCGHNRGLFGGSQL